MGSFRARGAGGVELELDELVAGTPRAEILADQIRKGDLVVLTDDGSTLGAAEIEAFLTSGDPVVLDEDDGVDPDAVPDATIPEVIDWVRGAPEGEDSTDGWLERAQLALDHERDGQARVSLIDKLEDVIASAES